MLLKCANIFSIVLITLVALLGCRRTEQIVIDHRNVPVKLVYLINQPEGGWQAYRKWADATASTLQAPKELRKIRGYVNADPTAIPNLLIEFEFDRFVEMFTYLNRPEIADLMARTPNYLSDVSTHIFIQRSDYTTGEEGDWPVKRVFFLDYPIGGKQAYLTWIQSVSPALADIPEVKASTSYDDYYGVSPQRMSQHEFASLEDAAAYDALPYAQRIRSGLDTRTAHWTSHLFIFRR